MAKEKPLNLEKDPDFFDNSLTRIHPDTKFVIENKTGLIMFIFKKQERNEMIQQLLDHKIVPDLDHLKANAYDDILVMS